MRNSGATAVVEGVGDHGCKYMTNGTVLILGATGKNFGAGMSGGSAYVLDLNHKFEKLYNKEMIEVMPLDQDQDITLVKTLIFTHTQATESERGKDILADSGQLRADVSQSAAQNQPHRRHANHRDQETSR